MSESDQKPISTRNWKAYHDHQPGPDSTPVLRVSGICTFNTDGYTVTLEPTRSGTNPDIYMMRLHVEGSGQGVPEVITDEDVHYELATATEYTQVHIIGVTTIDVEELEASR